jgi:dTMP kinase
MFIVLEGLDGAGKSTQLKKFQEYFTAQQLKSEFIHFPRFDAPVWGELIAKFLRGDLGDVHSVNPYVVGLLYAGDRYDAATQIRQWILQGRCVLADRYVYSNIAYQCAKLSDQAEKQLLRTWILHTEYTYFNIPKPDLTLFLDVPLKHVEEKLTEERTGNNREYLKGKKDIHESSLSLQQLVRKEYHTQKEQDETFHIIDCTDGFQILSPDLIFEKIKQTITTFDSLVL